MPPYCGVIICVIPEIPETMMSGVFALVRSPWGKLALKGRQWTIHMIPMQDQGIKGPVYLVWDRGTRGAPWSHLVAQHPQEAFAVEAQLLGLTLGKWNIISLVGKIPELACQVEKYWQNITSPGASMEAKRHWVQMTHVWHLNFWGGMVARWLEHL